MPARAKEAENPPAQPLESILRRLGERRTQLDALDDRLTATIKLVERVLHSHVAVKIIKVIWYNGDTDQRFEQLVFTKMNGKWCLAIELGQVHNGEEDETISERTALSNCSREKRSQMFADGHVEVLLRDAIVQVEKEIAKREAALAAADRLMSALQGADAGAGKEEADDDDDGIPF